MDEDIYLQTIGIKMILPDGTEAVGKFMGLAICTPDEWNKLKENNEHISQALAEKDCLLFQDPISIEEAMAGKEEYNDVVDIVREELRKDHHDQLKEKENEK